MESRHERLLLLIGESVKALLEKEPNQEELTERIEDAVQDVKNYNPFATGMP